MTERVYTINELKQLISESASEFKAKIGDGVTSANKKENSSSYSSAKKKLKDLDGGGDEAKPSKEVHACSFYPCLQKLNMLHGQNFYRISLSFEKAF